MFLINLIFFKQLGAFGSFYSFYEDFFSQRFEHMNCVFYNIYIVRIIYFVYKGFIELYYIKRQRYNLFNI